MSASISIIAEVEAAVQSASPERRISALRGVTDIFVSFAHCFTEEQILLFDDVLRHLMKHVQTKTLIELSTSLAPIDNAPIRVMGDLARHNDILVAAPVLMLSTRLTNDDLIDIAKSNSQEHLCWIAKRARLDQQVTDVLIERGSGQVAWTLAKNNGARFSEMGYATIVQRARNDASLAEHVGTRVDLPPSLLSELILKASAVVRTRLLEIAPVERHEEICRIIKSVSNDLTREQTAPRNYAAAQTLIMEMQRQGQLNEAAIGQFVKLGKYEEMIVGLSMLSEMPVELTEQLMKHVRHDGVLIACKAADIHWPVTETIIVHRFPYHSISADDLIRAKADFLKLTRPTAKRILRFWQVQGVIGALKGETISHTSTIPEATLH
jgi:uncharacterized protein (DUF2336 family)